MYHQVQEYIDSLNEDYELIRNEYADTELFKEIIHCLNWLFPNWKTNANLGHGAPEFVLTTIHQIEDSFNNDRQVNWLKALYDEILDTYTDSKNFYFTDFQNQCHQAITNMSDDEFLDFYGKEEESCSDMDLEHSYYLYKEQRLNMTPYDFFF